MFMKAAAVSAIVGGAIGFVLGSAATLFIERSPILDILGNVGP